MSRSPTVPVAGQSEADVLDVRAEVWERRPLLREIYRRYFAEMTGLMARREGKLGLVVEIGGGSGNYKAYFEGAHKGEGVLIATDIVPTVHCDAAADATALPFADGSVDNMVMQDVLHHVPYPLAFFAEAQRVLRVGGRVVMTEPYISPASRVVFKLAHPEPVEMGVKLFGEEGEADPVAFAGEGAFASNQAVPTVLFGRDLGKFQRRFPGLRVVCRLRRSLVVYPLSGGFSGPRLLPGALVPLAWGVERLLGPLARWLAFRLVVVVERVG